jgi:hypothetical protein
VIYLVDVARQSFFLRVLKNLWAALVEFPISLLVMFLIMFNLLRFYERLSGPGYEVQVFVAKKLLARWLFGCRVGVYLPGKIILPAPASSLLPTSCLNAVFAYGLERCRQWRQWSVLFPVAYAIAAVIAIPYPIWNNYFTRAARDAARR